jgi:hypothetical protein
MSPHVVRKVCSTIKSHQEISPIRWIKVGEYYKYEFEARDTECSCCRTTYTSIEAFTKAEMKQIQEML